MLGVTMDVSEVQGEVPLSDLTAKYVSVRDKRNELKAEYEKLDSELSTELKEIEQKMLDVCKKLDVNSINTNAGTIIRSIKTRYWTNDWESMYRFIKDHGAFALLERRLHQSNMKQFLEENPDTLPEGLNQDKEYTVVVRRAK
jgi:hypothetical protein